ncbi:hypothetical protein BZL43_03550 [Pseudomonas sp. PICF141]|nr:hypothetical protein BZL43_03550 [Pseudomonas sp. PICF141]
MEIQERDGQRRWIKLRVEPALHTVLTQYHPQFIVRYRINPIRNNDTSPHNQKVAGNMSGRIVVVDALH